MTARLSNAEMPEVLYKYRSWNNKYHKRLLTNREIYLANIYSFNDPFDSTIPVRWQEMTINDCFAQNLEMVEALHPDKTKKEQRLIAKKVTDSKQLWHPERMQQEKKKTFDKWNDIIGLISLSEKPDDILMWSHYGDFHKGFAVGLSTKQLISDNQFDYIDKVNYSTEYPVLKGTDVSIKHFHQRFFSKYVSWEYESEWRITKNHITKKQRKVRLKKETIVELVLGCQIAPQDKYKICNFIKKRLPHVVIKQAERDTNAFKLNVKQIED